MFSQYFAGKYILLLFPLAFFFLRWLQIEGAKMAYITRYNFEFLLNIAISFQSHFSHRKSMNCGTQWFIFSVKYSQQKLIFILSLACFQAWPPANFNTIILLFNQDIIGKNYYTYILFDLFPCMTTDWNGRPKNGIGYTIECNLDIPLNVATSLQICF